jgi:hypothetical protein
MAFLLPILCCFFRLYAGLFFADCGYGHNVPFQLYFLQTSEVEAPEIHVVLDVAKAGFYFCASSLSELLTYLTVQIFPRLLLYTSSFSFT